VGDIQLMKFVLTLMDQHLDESTVEAAARGGHLGVLEWLAGRDPPCPIDSGAVVAAAWAGHLEVLKWLRLHVQKEKNGLMVTVTSEFTKRCHLKPSLRWSPLTPDLDVSRKWDSFASYAAARGGHLGVLEWLREVNFIVFDEATCEGAARGGRLDILQWARGQNPPCPWDEATTEAAAKGGHTKCLMWAHQQGCPWNFLTCTELARGGHLELLQWAIDKGCPTDQEKMCNKAARYGHFNVLKWLHKVGKWCTPENDKVCVEAAYDGRLDILQWAIEIGCPNDHTAQCKEAARCGNLEILKWLHSVDDPEFGKGYFLDPNGVNGAARGSHQELVNWAGMKGCWLNPSMPSMKVV